jgi:hypothetical protein
MAKTMTKKKGTKAQHGERMVQISVRFWTNNLASKKRHIVPKHVWDCGMVQMDTNGSHGIKSQAPTPFHSLAQLSGIVERVILKHGLNVHHGYGTKKYAARR